MSVTVLEILLNAKINFETSRKHRAVFDLAMEQLENGIKALENGKGVDHVMEEYEEDDSDVDEILVKKK